MRATRESPVLGGISSGLSTFREWLDKIGDAKYQRPPGVQGLGEMMVGTAPEEVREWARGNSPFSQEPNYGNILDPRIKPGREQGLLDVAMTGADIGGLGLAGLRRGARAAYPALNPEVDMSRREFLGNTGKLAAGAAAVSMAPSILRSGERAAARDVAGQAAIKAARRATAAEYHNAILNAERRASQSVKADYVTLPGKEGKWINMEELMAKRRKAQAAAYAEVRANPAFANHKDKLTYWEALNHPRSIEFVREQEALGNILPHNTKEYGLEKHMGELFHPEDKWLLNEQINHLSIGGSVTMPNNYRKGGRVRMI